MLAWVAVGVVVFVVLLGVAPEAVARLAADEGPLEHVSHGVLGVAVVGWGARALAPVAAWGGRRGVLGAALALAWMLAEEIDYGAVYGVDTMARMLTDAGGHPNLHDAWGGLSSLLFGLPMLGIVAVGLRGPDPGSGWPGPTRGDAAALLLVAVGALGSLSFPVLETILDEVAELAAYVVLAVVAWRPSPRPRRSNRPRR